VNGHATSRVALVLITLVATIAAGCGAAAPSLVYLTPAPAAVTPVPSPAPVPTAAPSAPAPKATSKPTVPKGWVMTACKAMTSLSNTITYYDRLWVALDAEDFHAIGEIGGYISAEAFAGDTSLDRLPNWSAASGFITSYRATSRLMEDGGIAIEDGGKHVSVTTVKSGYNKYLAGSNQLSGTLDRFHALQTKYGFTCST